jgi:hypothetical protein
MDDGMDDLAADRVLLDGFQDSMVMTVSTWKRYDSYVRTRRLHTGRTWHEEITKLRAKTLRDQRELYDHGGAFFHVAAVSLEKHHRLLLYSYDRITTVLTAWISVVWNFYGKRHSCVSQKIRKTDQVAKRRR